MGDLLGVARFVSLLERGWSVRECTCPGRIYVLLGESRAITGLDSNPSVPKSANGEVSYLYIAAEVQRPSGEISLRWRIGPCIGELVWLWVVGLTRCWVIPLEPGRRDVDGG